MSEREYSIGWSGERYKSTVERFNSPGRNGVWSRGRIYRSIDGGRSWDEIPLKLSWRSLVAGRLLTNWPPETIDQVAMHDRALTFLFHDREDQYEYSPLPFGWGDESLWRARWLRNGRWRLERIRRLDFDGEDRHLRGET